MSYYEHADTDGDKMSIWPSNRPGTFLIRVDSAGGIGAATRIPAEDAPAVALAILEAGLEPYKVGCAADRFFAHEAVDNLRDAVQFRKDQAEREAEDAKVRAFRNAFTRRDDDGLWPTLGAGAQDNWRERYRAAREFFTRDEGISVEALAEALGHELPEG